MNTTEKEIVAWLERCADARLAQDPHNREVYIQHATLREAARDLTQGRHHGLLAEQGRQRTVNEAALRAERDSLRAALDKSERHAQELFDELNEGVFVVRAQTKALELVLAYLQREIADDPTQADPGTEIGALLKPVTAALAAAAKLPSAYRPEAPAATRKT